MAKKIITPEEYKAKQAKKAAKRKRFFEAFLKTLALCLAIALVYSTTTIAYTRIEMLTPDEVADTNGDLKDGFEDDGYDNSGSTGDSGTTDSGNSGNSGSTDAGNSGSTDSGDKGTAAADQEILDMYKKGVTAARTKSSKVIRVKDGAINYKGVAEAGKLSSVLSTLMGMFMVKDEASIEAKNEDWDKTKLPDPSALTINGIKDIKREDKGSTYVITVFAKDEKNPKAGGDGVGAVAGVIEESQITGAIGSVPGLTLEGISIDYENVVAVATIDKASGNCVELKLNAPCFLNVGHAKVPLVGEVDNAKVGIQVITEYKISY